MKTNMKIFLSMITLGIVLSFSLVSCKKWVEVDAPTNTINSGLIYEDNATAIGVLNGIYVSLGTGTLTGGGFPSLSLFPALSADELTLWSANSDQILQATYQNNLRNDLNPSLWNSMYSIIYQTNAAIEGLEASNKLNFQVKQQLLGESKFSRALVYFYLVNLYGDIPLAIKTDFQENTNLSKSTKSVVYQQIISDLLSAKSLLSDGYLTANAINKYPLNAIERVRPSKWAASALLARAYLYIGDYTAAAGQASEVIENTSLFKLSSLSQAFLKNSSESIWQIQPSGNLMNTPDGRLYILPLTGPNNLFPVYLSNDLLANFEKEDQRRYGRNWIDSVSIGGSNFFYPNKYKLKTTLSSVLVSDEYIMVLRLGEQYLIRAEARANLNDSDGAKNDLNAIRLRAGLKETTASDKSSLLSAIQHERRCELFAEFGHRWFDLKRTNTVDQVMAAATVQKGGTWKSTAQIYPIPQSELLSSPNLKQNPGY